MEAVNGVSEVDKGGPPPPSPLTGCYLLIVIGEPHCNEHKDIILQRVAKGLLSWDVNDCLVDLEKELAIITEQALEGEEARYGERLIQFASENLVTEILIHPVVSTLAQCVRNLLSSFTRHRHIIHAGYTFANNGSWVLQDGTFSSTDFSEAFQEIEVLRVIRAYENGISLDLHCAPEGDWTRLPKESFTKGCKVRVNPNDVLTAGSPSISSFISYLEPFLVPAELENILESSDVVGNIRFSRPTLYVFPGGQGDAALFGINGFNMLLDGGFSRKACFWDFVRHLDRLDAVLLTRLNNSNVNGISAILRRKKQNALYPQIGHFFCNIQERKAILSPDGDKDKDPLLINLLEEGQEIVSNLRHLSLTPQVCYRDSEPINLYHKVGHGTLDMYVLSPAKDSKEVREFLHKWNNNDQKLFANQRTIKDFSFPLQNLVSICALLVWQPANPDDTITRILFPGSSPQAKIFEGLDKIKSLDFIKHPVCSEKSLAPVSIIKAKQSVIERIIQPEKKLPVDNKKEKVQKPPPDVTDNEMKNGEVNGVVPTDKSAPVKKSDSTESEKSVTKSKKIIENSDKVEKPKFKPKSEPKPKPRSESQQRKTKSTDKKPSPTTPKKQVEKPADEPPKLKAKPSPSSTPAKSAKDANNRKVVESKIRAAPPKKEAPKPSIEKKDVKVERKPISRRPKDIAKLTGSPSKKVNGIQKPDSISRKGKLDKEGTTDSSTVSTPSAEQDSILKKDISKLTSDEIQNLKAQELADLKEEQEAVKEIEAVFRKGELQHEKPSDFRKIKDLSIDDKLESEEYLIIEKTEIEQEVINESVKEDETQKIARDSEESEKQRKLSDEQEPELGKQEKIQEENQEKMQEEEKIQDEKVSQETQNENQEELQKTNTDISKAKEEVVEASKEVSATSPEEKNDVSTDKKDPEEIKEVAQESQPDEKGSANIESGATTTAPTLPEDERMPLDEIKEDNGDQIIEEKHVKEDTKEKDVPVIQLPPKTFDNLAKLPPVVGIRLDKQSHIRDIVKTPDEVADLPVHEEVEFDHFDEYPSATETTTDLEENKKDEIDKDKPVKDLVENKDVAVEKEKTDVGVKKEEAKTEVKSDVKTTEVETKQIENIAKTVISEDLNKKELSKSPDEEKDTDELEQKQKDETQDQTLQANIEKVIDENKEKPEIVISETKPSVHSALPEKAEEDKTSPVPVADVEDRDTMKDDKKEIVSQEIEKSEKNNVLKDNLVQNNQKEEVIEKSETEVKEKDDKSASPDKLHNLKDQLPDVPKHEILLKKDKLEESVDVKEEQKLKEDVNEIRKINEKLQKLKEEQSEISKPEPKLIEDSTKPSKEELELKDQVDTNENKESELQPQDVEEKVIKTEEIITHKVQEPQHAEPVIITTDSLPDSPAIEDKRIEEKLELGSKSPKEREEDVAKIVASVAEVLKSDAPLEEFEGKIPFTIPYKTYTTELRETHITTVESPISEDHKTISKIEESCPKITTAYFIEEERKIAPIHEEPEIQESKISKMIKDSNELMQATSKIINDIKQTQPTDDKILEEQDGDSGTVHRMLVTASSEDGGEEIEICPPGTITFSRSSESSGRSSPDIHSQKMSQKSSFADTFSDGTVIAKSVAKDLQSSIEAGAKAIEDKLKDIKDEVIDKKDQQSISKQKDEILEKTSTKDAEKIWEDLEKIDKEELAIKIDSESKTLEHAKDKKSEEKPLHERKVDMAAVEAGILEAMEKPEDKCKEKTEERAKPLTDETGAVIEICEKKIVSEKRDDPTPTDAKEEETHLKEGLQNEATPIQETAKEGVTSIQNEVEHQAENIVKEVEEKKSFFGGIISDIESSILRDNSKLIEGAQKQVDEIKDNVTSKIDEMKEEVTAEKEELRNNAEELKQAVTSDLSNTTKTIADTADSKISETKEDMKKEAITILDKVENLIESSTNKVDELKETLHKEKESIIEATQNVFDSSKAKVSEALDNEKEAILKNTADFVDASKTTADNAKEAIAKEKDDLLDTAQTLTKSCAQVSDSVTEQLKSDVNTVIKNIEGDLQSAKETIDSQKEFASGVLTNMKDNVVKDVESKVEEIKQGVAETSDKTKAEMEEASKLMADKVDQKIANLQKEIDETTARAKEVIGEKQKILDELKESVVEKANEEAASMQDKAKTLLQDIKAKEESITKTVADEVKSAQEKLFEMEETKEKVVDDKVKSEVEIKYDLFNGLESVEKMVVDVLTADREDVSSKLDEKTAERKKSISELVEKVETEVENIVEKGVAEVLDFVEDTKEAITSVFKREPSKEEFFEKSGQDIEANYEKVSDMAKSIVFERCDAGAEEHAKIEKRLERSAESLEKDYEALTDMAKSTVFEKCEKPLTDVEKEEKLLERTAKDILENFDTVCDMTKSITFEKCDKSSSDKHDEKTSDIDKSSKTNNLDDQIAIDKEKSLKDTSPKSSGKSSPEKLHDFPDVSACKLSGKSSPALSNELKDLKEDSGKSTPDIKEIDHIKVDNQDSLLSGKSSPGLSGKSSPILSGTSSPGAKAESKDSLLSGKSTPELQTKPDDKEFSPSGKSSPAVTGSGKESPALPQEMKNEKLKDKPALGSGKASPLPEDKTDNITEKILSDKQLEDKLKTDSSKSTPLGSGKASPLPDEAKVTEVGKDIHEGAPGQKLDSGKQIEEEKKTEKLEVKITTTEIKDDKSYEKEEKIGDLSVKDISEKLDSKTATQESVSISVKEIESVKDKAQSEALEPKTLEVGVSQEKKLSISDVQITVQSDDKKNEKSTSDLSKSESPEDTKLFDKAETKDMDSIDSGIDTEVESKSKKIEEKLTDQVTKSEILTKEECTAGPSLTAISALSPAKTSNEDLHLSGKSTPDIAEVEKFKEMQEKHISGSPTPPTVPVSPIVKDISSIQSEETKTSTPIKSTTVTSLKESDLRSCTPGSDDYEIGASTHSDISSGQVSRAPHLLESERIESDEDDEVPGSPMSVTSQVPHSRSSSRYDFDDDRIGTKMDPMNTSFYGSLPDEEDTELEFEKAMAEHRQTRGEDLVLGTEESPSYLYEVTKAKYSARTPEPEVLTGQTQLDQINKNGTSNVMTASFMGDLPTETSSSETKKDGIEIWGKPLNLPSPAPPNDNKGTPKKERKLPANVTAKNKLNDDKKRAESPSKYRNKKYNPVYVDLTYVPHHGNSYYSYVDFFKRVRARYYVFSGIEPSREVYHALLEAKQTWDDKDLEVTIIPTYDTDILGYWVAENEELLAKCKIDLSPSASRCTINLQDHETSCSAYRLEF